MAEKEQFHMGLTAVWWIFLFAGSMYLMIATANSKAIVIAGDSYGQGTIKESAGTAEGEKRLEIESTQEQTGVFLIPVEKDAKAEDVAVENRYMNRMLHIFVEGAREEFYETCSVQGDVSGIRSAVMEKRRRGVLFTFRMDNVYEYRTSMEGNMLRVEVCDPHDLYKLLVVVDPVAGSAGKADGAGEDGRLEDGWLEDSRVETALAVCMLLPGQLKDENIRLYFTRTGDEAVTAEKRLAFAEALGADLYLSVGTAEEEDAGAYGICGWYNESYFIPEFGNVELADIVTRNVTVSCGNRAVGLKSAEEESILQGVRIPAAGVDLGNITNEKEYTLLTQAAYREKLAQGIAEALEEVYTEYYE